MAYLPTYIPPFHRQYSNNHNNPTSQNQPKYTVHYRHLVGSHTPRAKKNNTNNKTTYDIVMLVMTWRDS